MILPVGGNTAISEHGLVTHVYVGLSALKVRIK